MLPDVSLSTGPTRVGQHEGYFQGAGLYFDFATNVTLGAYETAT